MYAKELYAIDYTMLLEDTQGAPASKILYLERIRAILKSKAFMVFCLLLATLVYFFELEVYGIIVFILLISLILIFEKDLLPINLPIMLASISVLRLYDSFDTFKNFAWVIVIAIISIVFHFVFYPPRRLSKTERKGKLFFPYIAVSIALILGGAGAITTEEYFNGTSLYYVLMLGVGMLLIYMGSMRYINPDRNYDTKEYFAFSMFITGIFAILTLVIQYTVNVVPALLGPPFTYNIIEQYFCMSNNLCTVILMIMPFSFYLASRKNNGVIYFIAGVLQGFTMLLSTSRSGLIFSFALTLPLIIMTIKKDRAKRRQYFIALFAIFMFFTIIFIIGYKDIWIPLYTNYAFRLQDNWKIYLALALMSVLVISYFALIYKLNGKIQKVMVIITLVIGVIGAVGVFVFKDKAVSLLVKMDESRGLMAGLAIDNFYKYPIFGTGIGYTGTEIYYQPRTATMHFYHSAPVQIIGSMGLLGVITYAYMLISRLKVLKHNNSGFNNTVYLSALGLYLMSLVNPGIFIPLIVMAEFTLFFVITEQNNNSMNYKI